MSQKGEKGGLGTHGIWPKLLLVEKAPSHHLFAEGHHICRIIQAPVLVGPELASAAPSCLDLIHQEGTAMLEREDGETHPHHNQPTSDPVIQPELVLSKLQAKFMFLGKTKQMLKQAVPPELSEHFLLLLSLSQTRMSNMPWSKAWQHFTWLQSLSKLTYSGGNVAPQWGLALSPKHLPSRLAVLLITRTVLYFSFCLNQVMLYNRHLWIAGWMCHLYMQDIKINTILT